MHVSVLCACLDAIDKESDETVALRRISAVARIVMPIGRTDDKAHRHQATTQLITDLGFQDGLETVAKKQPEKKSGKLAEEILLVLGE